VEVIPDKSQSKERYTPATFFSNSGIPTYIDAKHIIAHNKIIIIDKETVIKGSFNFTKASEDKNAVISMMIKDKNLAKACPEHRYKHRGHSEVYERR
jgi:phosphatidylserine/phosphatidylglycerophosphate/cardiolipin synthase-like enzyme